MKDMSDQFHRNCGEILRLALVVEGTLEYFISNYFCHPQNQKTFHLSDIIVTKLTFERKKNIFKKICQEEETDEKEVNKIVESINFVKGIRNKVAHYEAYIENIGEGIKLQKRMSVTYKKDELKITDGVVKEVDRNRLLAIQGIHKLFMQITRPNNRRMTLGED